MWLSAALRFSCLTLKTHTITVPKVSVIYIVYAWQAYLTTLNGIRVNHKNNLLDPYLLLLLSSIRTSPKITAFSFLNTHCIHRFICKWLQHALQNAIVSNYYVCIYHIWSLDPELNAYDSNKNTSFPLFIWVTVDAKQIGKLCWRRRRSWIRLQPAASLERRS